MATNKPFNIHPELHVLTNGFFLVIYLRAMRIELLSENSYSGYDTGLKYNNAELLNDC